MDFTKGEVYKVVLDKDLYGVAFPYPVVFSGKCLTTDDTYVTLLESHTNMVKGFKKKQLSKSEPYQGTSVNVKSVLPIMGRAWNAAKSMTAKAPDKAKETKETKETKEPKEPKVALTEKELIPLLEKHLKSNTPFSENITEFLKHKHGEQKDCDLRGPGIIPLNGKIEDKCIYFTKKDTLDTISKKIKSQYTSTGNVYLLTTRSFFTFTPTTPVFIVSLKTKNDTYLLK